MPLIHKPTVHHRNRGFWALNSVAVAVVAAQPTVAQEATADPGIDIIKTATVVSAQTCAGIRRVPLDPLQPDLEHGGSWWRVVPSNRFAYFAASHSGEMVDPGEALNLVRSVDRPNAVGHDGLRKLIGHIQTYLSVGAFGELRAFEADGDPVNSTVLDDSLAWVTRPETVLRCKLPEPSNVVTSGIDPSRPTWRSTEPKIKPKHNFAIRGSKDALLVTGDDRLTADAATIGFNRNRAFDKNGDRTQTKGYDIKFAAGTNLQYPLGGLFLFGGYELKQSRAKPAPTLVPPATERDGDTEIVTLGAGVSRLIPLGGGRNPYAVSVNLQFDGTYRFDLVKNSERLEGQLSGKVYTLPGSLKGACGLGALTDLGKGFWSKCDVEFLLRYGKFTKRGAVPVATTDNYANLGPKAALSLYYGDPSEDAAFTTFEYLYLPRIYGDPNGVKTIKRHKATLGYRWWQGSKFALEVKGELTDGINPDSYADENAVSIGFGFLF